MHQLTLLVDGGWVQIGGMLIARRECLIVSLSPDKVIVVGGVGSWDSGVTSRRVEFPGYMMAVSVYSVCMCVYVV